MEPLPLSEFFLHFSLINLHRSEREELKVEWGRGSEWGGRKSKGEREEERERERDREDVWMWNSGP